MPNKNNIDIQLVLDKSQLNVKGSKIKELQSANIPIYIDTLHAIQHNKVIIVDDSYFQTGSFNLSYNAEFKNAENLLICASKEGTYLYLKNWLEHFNHSIKVE